MLLLLFPWFFQLNIFVRNFSSIVSEIAKIPFHSFFALSNNFVISLFVTSADLYWRKSKALSFLLKHLFFQLYLKFFYFNFFKLQFLLLLFYLLQSLIFLINFSLFFFFLLNFYFLFANKIIWNFKNLYFYYIQNNFI